MANSVLARTEANEVQLTITIPAPTIQKAFEEALADYASKAELPGFRKGKAPQKLVEEKIDKIKVYEEILQKILPEVYVQAIGEHHLQPIIAPKVELLNAKEGEDWQIRATTCERPPVALGDYKEGVRKSVAPAKLWTPDQKNKVQNGEAGKGENHDEKTQRVMQSLLNTAQVNLPSILVEDELNRSLSNLINQTEKLGLTVDQYLASLGKTVDQVRNEYRERVINDLKLQLILDDVAEKEKVEVSDKEVDTLIQASGDEKVKQELNSPSSKAYLKGILARRKALDYLSTL